MDKENEVFDTDSRPCRWVKKKEFGMPEIEPLKHVDLARPLLTTLAPVVSSFLKAVLRGELDLGRPVRIKDIMVTMRDGAKVALDVYFPKQVYRRRLKCPTILVRTPYYKDDLGWLVGSVFGQKGFVVVVQDVRGTGHSNSTGINNFMILERDDGLDVISWIKKQFWYNGRLGTWGASYLGMTQWCVYDSRDITCFSTQVSSPQNLWKQYNGLGINETNITLSRIHCDGVWFRDKVLEPVKERMPYMRYTSKFFHDPASALFNAKIDKEPLLDINIIDENDKKEIISRVREIYGVDLETHETDPKKYEKFVIDLVFNQDIHRYHDFMISNIGMDYGKYHAPFLMTAGWYDMFIKLNMEDFVRIQTRTPPGSPARKFSKLVVGPWAHGQPARYPTIKNPLRGGLLDMLDKFVTTDWFQYWLKDGAGETETNKFNTWKGRARYKREFIDMPPLLIFTMGRDRWRWEREWPLARTVYRNLYLHSSGRANSRKGDGTLDFQEPTTDEEPDRYVSDPANPVISRGGNTLTIPGGAFEQATAESRDDVLVYTSAPLKSDLEVTGNIKVVLHVTSSAVDTDFMVKLCDVFPNGKSYNISDLGIRARYRNGVLNPPELLEPGKVYRLEFEIFPTSILFKKGHRIRVDIASTDFPKFDINSGLGGRGTSKEYVLQKQVVYHDKDHPSYIVLPTIP